MPELKPRLKPAIRKARAGAGSAVSAKTPGGKPPSRRKKTKRSRKGSGVLTRFRSVLGAVPPVVLTLVMLVVLLIGASIANVLYWTWRKPTELLAPISASQIKNPAQTWAAYDDLFRRYSTTSISPELLAALAQIESNGNWAARTYWRWNFSASGLFDIYRPASSSVGMYQMTEAAFAEAQHYCIRDHVVVPVALGEGDCASKVPLSRVLPAQSVELTAVWLDRSVTRILGGLAATPGQRRDLAAIIHLCGGSPAKGFVRRGFKTAKGETCGDHDPADYLSQVQSLEKQFRKLAQEAAKGN